MKLVIVAVAIGLLYNIRYTTGCRCPEGCQCESNRRVHCARVFCQSHHYHGIPSDLPDNTTQLLINSKNVGVLEGDAFSHLPLLRHLDLSFNSISKINWTLSKESKVSFLTLAHNAIEDVDPDTFSMFTSLREFDISHNQLTPRALKNILYGLRNTSVESLWLSNNNIHYLEAQQFQFLTSLQTLDLSFCKIYKISESALLGSTVQSLSLSHNSITSFKFALPHWLIDLDLSHNYVLSVQGTITQLSGKLQQLDISSCWILDISENAFDEFAKLKMLRIANNRLQVLPVVAETLEYLDASFNKINRLRFEDFKYLYELRSLSLAGNVIHSIESETFIHQRFLTSLDLSHTNVSGKLIGCSLNTLEHVHINLSYNQIDRVPLLHASPAKCFNDTIIISRISNTSVDFSFNKIQTVDRPGMTVLSTLAAYDLSNNPFDCTFNYNFIDWIMNKQFDLKLFWIVRANVSAGNDYQCALPSFLKGQLVMVAFYMHVISVIILPFLIICMLVILNQLTMWAWYNRWLVRLTLYRVSQKIRQLLVPGRPKIQNPNVEYDAYLSYAECDESLVRDYILPGIDQELGGEFRLYADFRDGSPGTLSFSNMIESIDRSRIAIVILTKRYMSDPKYEYELNYIIRAMQNKSKNNILVIKCEDVTSDKIPRHLRYYIETCRFISLKESKDSKRLRKDVIRHLQTYR